jgi:phosphatidylglycerol:prolipoprotein diacylglycerol transferase
LVCLESLSIFRGKGAFNLMNRCVTAVLAGWAGALWISGMLASLVFIVHAAKVERLDRRVAYWASVSALAGGFIGGTLLGFYDYSQAERTWNLFTYGKSFCGGLVGGTVTALLFLRWKQVPVAQYGDILVMGLALGYAIGRIGCFFNGCDFGVCTDLAWGVQYPPGTEAYADHFSRGWIALGAASSLRVHPVQLYAAAAGLVMFLVLWRWKPAWPGQRIWLFALFYGIYRFCIEWLRGDFRVFVGGPFSLPQLVALLLIAGALAVSGWRRWRSPSARTLAPTCEPSVRMESAVAIPR